VAAVFIATTSAPAADSPAALTEARRCWSTTGEPGIAACRRALEDAGALAPARAARVELTLATRLGGLGRWEEAAAVHRQAVTRRPQDGEAHRRLGAALLHGLGHPADAEASLREAIRLGAGEARTWGDLALALVALGRPKDAVAAFDEALARDPKFLEGRPGSRAAYDAARQGRPWPQPSPAT
jgi:Flp pilus assembly protein TadD